MFRIPKSSISMLKSKILNESCCGDQILDFGFTTFSANTGTVQSFHRTETFKCVGEEEAMRHISVSEEETSTHSYSQQVPQLFYCEIIFRGEGHNVRCSPHPTAPAPPRSERTWLRRRKSPKFHFMKHDNSEHSPGLLCVTHSRPEKKESSRHILSAAFGSLKPRRQSSDMSGDVVSGEGMMFHRMPEIGYIHA